MCGQSLASAPESRSPPGSLISRKRLPIRVSVEAGRAECELRAATTVPGEEPDAAGLQIVVVIGARVVDDESAVWRPGRVVPARRRKRELTPIASIRAHNPDRVVVHDWHRSVEEDEASAVRGPVRAEIEARDGRRQTP